MPATATVSAWRNRPVDRTVPVAAMGRSYNPAVTPSRAGADP